MRMHLATILAFGSFVSSGCESGPEAPLDMGGPDVTVDAGAPSTMDAALETRDQGTLTDGTVTPEDAGAMDAAPTGPECLVVEDCDSVCAWFVECSVAQCPGYDAAATEELDGLCRGACDVLVDVLCNHRFCAETIDYISGLVPDGEYASACVDDAPAPASP